MPAFEPTELFEIKDVIDHVHTAKFRLPHFQRPFIWTKPKRLSLFETLISDWPFGVIMLWDPSGQSIPNRRLDIGVEENRQVPTRDPKALILDGQQRLATIYQQYWLSKTPKEQWADLDGRKISVLSVDLSLWEYHDCHEFISPKVAARWESPI